MTDKEVQAINTEEALSSHERVNAFEILDDLDFFLQIHLIFEWL